LIRFSKNHHGYARNSRARIKVGVRTYRVRAHARRLVAAMRRANPKLPDDPTQDQIEAELGDIVAAFVERWLWKETVRVTADRAVVGYANPCARAAYTFSSPLL
jgi:hypothetical protein